MLSPQGKVFIDLLLRKIILFYLVAKQKGTGYNIYLTLILCQITANRLNEIKNKVSYC